MTMIRCSYSGNLHCNALHEQSGVKINTDAPKDHDGRGESFSPMDLLATALGTCLLTVMGITAERRGFELGEAKAMVENHDNRAIATHKYASRGVISTPHLTTEQQKLLQRVAQDCPVKSNLDESIQIELHWT